VLVACNYVLASLLFAINEFRYFKVLLFDRLRAYFKTLDSPEKHSSFLCLAVSDEEKSFHCINTWPNVIKLLLNVIYEFT
jgi:hypothetical protein